MIGSGLVPSGSGRRPRRLRLGLLVAWCALAVGGVLSPAAVSALDPTRQMSQFGHERWTRGQGLPQDSVRVLAQATDGALWVGTDEGLTRFDGTEFTTFVKGTAGLPSASITALAASRDGSMWVGTLGGISRYQGGQFRTLDKRDGADVDYVSGLVESRDGTLWASGGRDVLAVRGGVVTAYDAADGVPASGVRTLLETRDGTLLGAAIGAVVRFDGTRFGVIADGPALSGNVPMAMAEGASGSVWLAGSRGMFNVRLDGQVRAYTAREGLPDDIVRAVEVDRQGSVWAGTSQGLARLERDQFVAVPVPGLSPAIWDLFEDHDGSLWVGTSAALHQFREQVFSVYGTNEGFPSDQPSAVFQHPDGALWIGFRDAGLLRREGTTSTRLTQRDGLPANEVFSIRGATNGDLLVGTRLGLARVSGRRVTRVTPVDSFNRLAVYDAVEDRPGRVWLATHDGLIMLEGDRQTRIVAGGALLASAVLTLAVDRDGAIWAGSYGEGLWRVAADGTRRQFTMADGLPSNAIRALTIDAAGTLWIGTVEGGLAWYRQGAFGRFGPREGLESGNVGQIIDDAEHLWLGTSVGLSQVPKSALLAPPSALGAPGTTVPHVFISADGLRSSNAAPGSPVAGGGAHDRDGRVWVVTANGLASLAVSDLRPPAEPGPARITSVVVDGQPVADLMDLSLPSGARRVEFNFSATSLLAPDRLRFRYRLEGLDASWTNAGVRRSADYINLGPGQYRFVVEPSLLGGGTGVAGALAFERQARWYERRWAPLATAGVLLLVAWGGYWFRLRQLRGRFALVLEERNRISRELHDTLAQDFVGIGSQLGAVATTLRSDPDAAERRLGLARRMTQHSLTEARRSVMDLRSSVLNDRPLVEAIRVAVGEITAGLGVRLEVADDGAGTGLGDELDHQLLRIAQEAVTNALKHAEPSGLEIRLSHQPGQVTLTVHDDGRGFDPAQAFVSARGHFGLLGMRERARRVGGDLRVESAPGTGTTIHVTVPRP